VINNAIFAARTRLRAEALMVDAGPQALAALVGAVDLAERRVGALA
jgi:hypothetical protein